MYPEELIGTPDLPLGFTLLLAVGMVGFDLLVGRMLLHSTPVKADKS